jgi:DHA1 family bicyclomycin/chloramphenicol resistance-like MFS transporter
MVRIGNLAAFPALFFGLYWAFFAELAVWALFLPIFAIGFFHGFTQPNLIAGAVSVNPRLAGSASGLLGFVQMALGAGGTFAMGVLQDGTMRPLAVAMFACAIGSLLFHRMAVRARSPETVAPGPGGS